MQKPPNTVVSGGVAYRELTLAGLDRLGQLRRDLEQVADDAEVGDLEDRRLFVLVHRDDRLGRLHARAVLDRAGDAQRDVQLRRHGLARLAHLELARVVAGVDGGTRGTDGGTERVGQFLHHAEVLGAADTTTTGNHDGGLGELRTVACDRGLTLGDLGRILGLRGHVDVDHLTGARCGLGLDRTRTDRDHRGVAGGLGLDGERATEDAVDADRPFADVDDVGQDAGADSGGQPAPDLLAVGAGGQQHTSRSGRLDQRGQHVDVRGDQVVLGVIGFGDVDLGGAGLLQRVGQRRSGARLAHHNGGRLAQLARGGDQFGGDLLHRALGVLNEHKYFSHMSSKSFWVYRLMGYRLDDLLSNQVLGDLRAAVALVGDLLAGRLRRLRGRRGDLGT